jgi:hypothetical protein
MMQGTTPTWKLIFFLSPRLGQGNQEQCAKDVVEHERNLQEFAMLHGAWIGL